ncbi:MAG: hypothetical protein PHO66_00290 [Eubacteriales bacterium]|nr:hypothetical protein [Eubacteriales bacterium]
MIQLVRTISPGTVNDICAILAFYPGVFEEAKILAETALQFDPTKEK